MYRLDREEFVSSPYVFLWTVLGFQAGYLNAFGFLACGRYVSHVTGFGTQIGVALAGNHLAFALELLGFPLSFILGAFVNGLLTSAKIERQLKPRFDWVTASIPLFLALLLFLGECGVFGVFGEELLQARDFFLLFLLSFVCGLQNGCFAVLTRGQIRTTHLTGISTDIGTDLARIWFGGLKGTESELTRKANTCRVATVIAFATGSILSVILSQRLDYASLVLPGLTSIGVFIAIRSISKALDRRMGTA